MNLITKLTDGYLLATFPVILPPLFIYVILQEVFADVTQGTSNNTLKKIGNNFGGALLKHIQHKTTKKSKGELIDLLLAQLPFFGLGTFDIVRYKDTNTITIKNNNNPIARQYRKSFGKQYNSINHLTLGILEGALCELFASDVHAEEEMCIAQDKPHCLYVIKKRDAPKENCSAPLDFAKLHVGKTFTYNAFISKAMHTGMLSFEQGHLKIMDLSLLNLPFSIIEMVAMELAQEFPQTKDIVTFIAHAQTANAIHFLKKKFGLKHEQLLDHLFLQMETMLGLSGKAVIEDQQVRCDVTQCIPFYQLQQVNGTAPTLLYMNAIIESVVSLVLGKATGSVQYHIRDGTLVTITIPFEQGEVKAPEINKQYKELILEKIKHKYFLN